MAEKKKLKKVKVNKEEVRQSTDVIVDRIDEQALENIKTIQETNKYREELITSLHRLDSHSICPGSVPSCNNALPKNKAEVKVEKQENTTKEVHEVHGADCHCSKCCPNPTPNWFQKNKLAILLGVLVCCMLVLAIGWSPSGITFEAIQESYVELIVDFFKMAIIGVASVVIFNIAKKDRR